MNKTSVYLEAAAVLTGHIWVVSGSYGEYSDREEWNICYFFSERDAKEYVTYLPVVMRAWRVAHDSYMRMLGLNPDEQWTDEWEAAAEKWWDGILPVERRTGVPYLLRAVLRERDIRLYCTAIEGGQLTKLKEKVLCLKIQS